MNKLLITLLILFLLPTVASFEITNTKFTLLSGQEITQIPYDLTPNQLLARFEVEYRGTFRPQINADLSSIHTSGMHTYNDQILTCQQLQDDLVRCSNSGPYRIYTQQQNNILRFTAGFNSDNFTHTFNIKTTDPEIVSIQIQDCDDCHIRNNQLYTIKFNFNQEEKFSNGLFFGFNNPQGSITNDCEGNSCTGQIIGSCSNGPLNLLIDQESKNDAGQYIKGQLIKQLICDNDAPIIDDIESSFEVIETDQNLNLKINVTDQRATKIDFEFKIDSVGYNQNVTCTNKQGQTFVCDLNINLRDQSSNPLFPGTYNLEIIARDNAKNSARSQQQIIILQSDEDTITDWVVRSERVAHPSMNVETLIFPRETYMESNLVSSSNMMIRDIQINPGGCVPVSEDYGQQGNIQNFNLVDFSENKIITKFTVQSYGSNNRYQGINQLRFECPATIYSRTPTSIIQQPQQLNLTITINLRSSPRLDMMLTDSLEDRVEEALETARTINRLRTIFDATAFVCGATTGIHGIFGSVSVAMTSLESAAITLQTTPVAGEAFGQGVRRTTDGIISGYGNIRTKIQRDWAICTLFTCERGLGLELLPNDIFSNDGIIPGLAQIPPEQLNSLRADPYKSLVTASATLCLPAVMFHIERFQNVHCEYIECLAEGVAMQGIDPAFCREARAMAQCVMLAESVTNMLVPYDVLQRAITNVRNYLSNPGAAISGALFTYACRPTVLWFGAGVCQNFQAATSLYESGRTLYELGKVVLSPPENACERSLAVVTAYQDYFNNPHLYPMPTLQSPDGSGVSSEYVHPSEFTQTFNVGDDKVGYCKGKNCGLFERDGFDPQEVEWESSLINDGETPAVNVFDEKSKTRGLSLNDELGAADQLGFRRGVEAYHKAALANVGEDDQEFIEWLESFERINMNYEDANEALESKRVDLQNTQTQLNNYRQIIDDYANNEANILDRTDLTRDEIITVKEITLRGRSQGGLNDDDFETISRLEEQYEIDILDGGSEVQQTINALIELENQREEAQQNIDKLELEVNSLEALYNEELERFNQNFPEEIAQREIREQREEAARKVFNTEEEIQRLNSQLNELNDRLITPEVADQINQDIEYAQNRIDQIKAQRDILINDLANIDPVTGDLDARTEAELSQLFTQLQAWEDNIERNTESLETFEKLKEEIADLEQEIEQKQQELVQANEEYDEVTEELNKEEAEQESEAEKWLKEQFDTTYGSLKFLFGAQRGFAIIDKYLPLGNNDWSDLNLGFIGLGRLGGLNLGFMNNVVQGLEQATQVERMICQNIMRNERTFSDEFQLIQNSGAGFRLGAYLTGKRISTTDPLTQETEYTYIIGGTINPNKEAEFELILRSNTMPPLTITENITTNTQLRPGVNNPIGSMSNQGYINLKEVYNEVCIEFSEPLVDLFDLVRGLGPGGINQLRNDVVCVDIQIES